MVGDSAQAQLHAADIRPAKAIPAKAGAIPQFAGANVGRVQDHDVDRAVGGRRQPLPRALPAAAAQRRGVHRGPAQWARLCGRAIHRGRHRARPVRPQVGCEFL